MTGVAMKLGSWSRAHAQRPWLLLLLCTVLAGHAHGAVSASLSGVVRDPGGAAVANARVSIVHRPSGTAAQALTLQNGAFFQSGLRVGGPFDIRVRAAGFRDALVAGVTLRPGTQSPLIVRLEQAALEEIVVTAPARAVHELNNGVGSAYTSDDIARQPAIHRDAIRTLLTDPLAQSDGVGHLAVAGANPRFNGLAIDGVLQQDDFGLGTNTYATERSPINLDAVESVSLVASDYSVAAGGFTGGLVQITTRSGGNEWEGAVFHYLHHDGLVGNRYDGGQFAPAPFTETETGMSLGGPLVRDRLFVFLSHDEFESAWYDVPTELDAVSLQFYSDWTDRLSSGLRLSRKTFTRGQICRAGPDVGALEFDLAPAQAAGTELEGLLTEPVTLTAGCDRFRHANEYEDERVQVYADIDYLFGDHLLKAGVEMGRFDLYNLFVPGSRGRFVFDGLQAIFGGVARVDYINAVSNDPRDAAADWGYRRRAFFVQDAWTVSPELELTAGLRYERIAQGDAPAYSDAVFAAYGVRTDANLDGAAVWMPRLGLRYTGLERTVISGGVGLFAGGEPQVWISNAFQPPVVFARIAEASGITPFSVPEALLQQVAAGAAAPVDAIAEDFDMPADWKASVRVQREFDLPGLGRDFLGTVQYLHTSAHRSFIWRNLAHTHLADAQPTGEAPDGRRIYADLDALGYLNLTALGNHGGGSAHVWSLAVSKSYDFGVDFSASYARQDVEAVAEGTSARGISNWRALTVADRNDPQARRSPHQTTHSWKLRLGYERAIGPLNTRVDVFGRVFSGRLFTYTFDVDRGNALFGRAGAGESPFDADPLYIPAADDPAVVYASTFDRSGFENYVQGAPGGIHAPYSEVSGWNRIWDLRLQVELPGAAGLARWVGENRIRLVLDVENFPNLLNSKWGRFDFGPGNGQAAIVRADLVRAADVADVGVDAAPALTGDAPRTACRNRTDCVYRFNSFDAEPRAIASRSRSVYRIRLGIRFEF